MAILPTLSVHLNVFLLESSAGVTRTTVCVPKKSIQLSPRASTDLLKPGSMSNVWIARGTKSGLGWGRATLLPTLGLSLRSPFLNPKTGQVHWLLHHVNSPRDLRVSEAMMLCEEKRVPQRS